MTDDSQDDEREGKRERDIYKHTHTNAVEYRQKTKKWWNEKKIKITKKKVVRERSRNHEGGNINFAGSRTHTRERKA